MTLITFGPSFHPGQNWKSVFFRISRQKKNLFFDLAVEVLKE